jgi:hypothetical protein
MTEDRVTTSANGRSSRNDAGSGDDWNAPPPQRSGGAAPPQATKKKTVPRQDEEDSDGWD